MFRRARRFFWADLICFQFNINLKNLRKWPDIEMADIMPSLMATAKELNLSCGDPFQHTNEAGVWILGTVHNIDTEGRVKAWVQVCSLHSPIEELFPGGEVEFLTQDNGFSKLPKPEKIG